MVTGAAGGDTGNEMHGYHEYPTRDIIGMVCV